MRTLRRVVGEPPLILAWSGGTTLVVLLAAWLLRPYFPMVVALAFGGFAFVVLLTIRDLAGAERTAADGLAGLGRRQAVADTELRELRGRMRSAEESRRERDELADRVARLESVLSLLTRWPRDPSADAVTSTLFFRPAGEGATAAAGSPRDDLARFRGRRAAQERGRKRVERWRTQLTSGPDPLAIYVDVFWLPHAAAGGTPLLAIRRTRMSGPARPAGPLSPGDHLLAMEERFADARSRREIAFWTAPAGEDLGRLVARLAADQDRWQDLADGLPPAVREGDADRLGPAATAELEALVEATDPVRIVRYTAVLDGLPTGEPTLRHAAVVRTEADPVAALVADAFVRALEGMAPERPEPVAPDVLLGGAAAAGLARWHGTDGLRADARSVLEQRRRRGVDAVRRATAEPARRRPRHGVPG